MSYEVIRALPNGMVEMLSGIMMIEEQFEAKEMKKK